MRALERSGTDLTPPELERAYAWPTDRSWVRLNFISSVDGSTQGADGRSGSLGCDADRVVFRLLRSLSDVVLVGAGTARAERYRPVQAAELDLDARARAGLTGLPVLAVVSRSLELSPALLTASPDELVVLTTAAAPAGRRAALAEHARVVVAGDEQVDPVAAVRALVDLGHRRVLAEGGPRLARDLAAAGALDDVCLTLRATLVAGHGLRLLAGPGLDPPVDLELASLLADRSDLFLRYTTVRSRP
jgi:riboflavin biosynthesis pyrimidine reductase